MASHGRHEDQRSTLSLIAAGFHEFTRTSGAYLAKVSLFHKLIALGTLVLSTLVIGGSNFFTARMVTNREEGFFQKLRKFKVVRISLNAVDRLLHVMESLVVPNIKSKQSPKANSHLVSASSNSIGTEINGLPKLLNLRHISISSSGTPCNKERSSDAEDWTPFSSVSTTVDESLFDPSCVSLMEDLSQSTISTPIRDLRQQMASKIRTWRLAIQDLEGAEEFRSWSPESPHGISKNSLFVRLWKSLSQLISVRQTGSSRDIEPGSGRKRKRMDADDDDLALYIPLYKGQSKLNGSGLLSSETNEQPAPPGIRGLSVVPIIGNWFSSVQSEDTERVEDTQLDHISLIQRDCFSSSKEKREVTNDHKPYEITSSETIGEDIPAEQNYVSVEHL
ncbi:uncharacterized protein LOC130698537 isoform X2 [Daphnia carinata]|uniref:uncharacterized protein LOC130698537 isoform X2 n=1 Tax=Daphnia carinata TaxID=120202 RepID=UPI00257B5072|nr:uncharacterized protein LOC130698537 isoform X2 [Daphnia carinata]